MNTAAIDIKNLSQSYGDLPILKNLSLSIQKGAFFIIIGPNGSGKTTLIRIISRVEKYRKGRLKILGNPLRQYTRKTLAKTLAVVPQMHQSDFPFTVAEIVIMGRTPHLGILGLARKKDLESAAQAMAFTGVDKLADRKIDQLSGGERQRVFIARAICQEPKIMLLDEPTASLDLAHQVRVMDLMKKLKNEMGITVIMVSHDINLASMYGDRLLLLKEGRIIRMGVPEDVITRKTLEEAYGCSLLVDQSPSGKFQRVTLVPGSPGEQG